MVMLDPTDEQKEQAKEVLARLVILYNQLVDLGHDSSLLTLSRTDDPHDEDYVCQLEFLIDEKESKAQVNVNLISDSFTADEVQLFIERAERIMSDQLIMMSPSTTFH